MLNRAFVGTLLAIAVPIALQNMISFGVAVMDSVMLGSFGDVAIAAANLGGQPFSILMSFGFGLSSGGSVLIAQYWGKGELRAIERVEGIALRFSILISLLFAIPAVGVPQLMMKVFTNDAELIELGASYLRIISVSYLCWSISEIYLAVLRSIERVRTSTALNVTALLLNIFLNAVFVYGWFGAPKLGICGVALATSISRAVQLVLCFWVSAVSKDVKIRLRAMLEKGGVLLQDFIRLSLPALGNDILWSVAFSMYSVIMGHMGTDVVAANSLVVVVRNFGTVMCFAIASASGIYVGKEIGANQFEAAERDGSRALRLTVATAAVGGVLIAVASPFVIRYASLTETATDYLKIMLAINVYYIMGSAVNTTLIAGLFRAGGDSRFGLICDAIDMWCYAVPLGFIAALCIEAAADGRLISCSARMSL